MKRVLFVCLGNICRSPLAEAIFNHKIREDGLAHIYHAESCGTNYQVGDKTDSRTLKSALKHGISIDHLGRRLGLEDFQLYDFILVMDQSNLQYANRMAEDQHRSKLKLLRSFDPAGRDKDVPDPYYGTEKDFQEVFEILDRTIGAFIQEELKRPLPYTS